MLHVFQINTILIWKEGNPYCAHICTNFCRKITSNKESNLFFFKVILFSEVPHKPVSWGWLSRGVNDAQPKVLTSDSPNIVICAFERVSKVYTQYKRGPPRSGGYKSVCAARGQHNAAPRRTVDRYARRWEGLRRKQFASVASLPISSFSLSFLLLLQSVLTWLSWGIKLLKLKWIQEAIFGLQVRIIVKSVWIFNVCIGSPVSFKLMFLNTLN